MSHRRHRLNEGGRRGCPPPKNSGGRGRTAACLLAIVFFLSDCGGQERLKTQQQQALTSLKSTVVAVCDGWLSNNVSTTFARTALDSAATLLEKERTKLQAAPDALADPALDAFSKAQQQLAERIAWIRKALAEGDATAVRLQMLAIGGQRFSQ